MHDLEITWPGGQLRFSPEDSPVLIGRSSSAAVVVPQGTVSRRHLTVSWNGHSWQAEDSSTHGSFDPIGVRLATSWTLGTDVVVRLGSPRGVELSMRLITQTVADRDLMDPYGDAESPPTVVDFGPPPRPDASAPSGMLHVPSWDGLGSDDSEQDHWGGHTPAGDEPAYAAGALHDSSNGIAADEPAPVIQLSDRAAFAPASSESGESAGLARFDHAAHGEGASQPEGYAPPVALDDHDAGSQDHDPVGVDSQVLFHPDQPQAEHDENLWLEDSVVDLRDDQSSAVFDPAPAVLGDQSPRSNPAATFVETDTLRLQIDGEDHVFLPGHEVTVGRDPSCMVTIDERHSLVSRRHLRFVHAQGDWWLEDASSKGTYIHGRRLNRPYRAEGAFIAQLGDPSAGTMLRVVTSGQHRQPTNRAGMAIAAVAAAALVLAALVAWLVLRGDDTNAEALATAKRSTVMLLSDSGHGSGFFVSRSMIVTNQHVAAMADRLVVAVSPEIDEPAEIRYVAELVENHPFLDIAVVRITNEAAINDEGSVTIGASAGSADVPLLPLGDSTAVTIGDPVSSVGFPDGFALSTSDESGMPRLAAAASTSGQAANFTSWPGCGSDLGSFIPPDAPATVACSAGGNVEKGVLLASFSSGEGASGSAVLHEDKVVAVLFAGDSGDATVNRSITTNAFSEWLSDVLAENN